MATAEFSKFAGILSAALSQHHLPGSFPVSWLFASGGQSIGAFLRVLQPIEMSRFRDTEKKITDEKVNYSA